MHGSHGPSDPTLRMTTPNERLPDDAFEALVDAGLVTADDVRRMTDEALLALDGVGPATVRKIRKVLG